MKREDIAEGDGSGRVLIQGRKHDKNSTRAHTGSGHFRGAHPTYSTVPTRTNQHQPRVHENAASGKPPHAQLTDGREGDATKQAMPSPDGGTEEPCRSGRERFKVESGQTASHQQPCRSTTPIRQKATKYTTTSHWTTQAAKSGQDGLTRDLGRLAPSVLLFHPAFLISILRITTALGRRSAFHVCIWKAPDGF